MYTEWRVVVNYFFFFKQQTAYEITRRDWSSDVCSSDLKCRLRHAERHFAARRELEGIREQVGDDLLQPLAIGLHRRGQFFVHRDGEFEPLVGGHLAECSIDVVADI